MASVTVLGPVSNAMADELEAGNATVEALYAQYQGIFMDQMAEQEETEDELSGDAD